MLRSCYAEGIQNTVTPCQAVATLPQTGNVLRVIMVSYPLLKLLSKR